MANDNKPPKRTIKNRRRAVIILGLMVLGLVAANFVGALKGVSSRTVDLPLGSSSQMPPPALAIVLKGGGVFEVDGKGLDFAGLERRLKEQTWREQDQVKITIATKEWQQDWEQARALVTKSGVTRVATELGDAARKK